MIEKLRALGDDASPKERVAVLDAAQTAPEGVALYRADVTDDAQVRESVGGAVRDLGGLDILVNNAGIGAQGGVGANDDEEWHRVFDVNVVGMVRVNAVNPGTADTPWIGRLLERTDDPAAERAALEARQPHGRLVSAAEVAGAIAYLASPASGSTTGTSVAVDGGMSGLRLRPPRSDA